MFRFITLFSDILNSIFILLPTTTSLALMIFLLGHLVFEEDVLAVDTAIVATNDSISVDSTGNDVFGTSNVFMGPFLPDSPDPELDYATYGGDGGVSNAIEQATDAIATLERDMIEGNQLLDSMDYETSLQRDRLPKRKTYEAGLTQHKSKK
jgi:hypothetical protein